MGGGSRHAVPVAGACSDAVGDGAMLFSSSAFPIWLIVACFSFSVAIALASCHSFDSIRGRRDGRPLGYCGVAHNASSMNVYNEYDVCDIYKRYKDTRIREYDGYMR